MLTKEQTALVYTAVLKASEEWKSAFNSGDALGCANQYEETAIMDAQPLGKFTGKEDIHQFWSNLLAEGYSEVIYLNPTIEVIDEGSAILTAKWTMNKAQGSIHKELWVIQSDGHAKLKEDIFAVEG